MGGACSSSSGVVDAKYKCTPVDDPTHLRQLQTMADSEVRRRLVEKEKSDFEQHLLKMAMSPLHFQSKTIIPALPWIWLELTTGISKELEPERIFVLARVNRLDCGSFTLPTDPLSPTFVTPVAGFSVDFVDDGHDHCALCIGTMRRAKMSWYASPLSKKLAYAFGGRCGTRGYVLNLTSESWNLTQNTLRYGTEEANYHISRLAVELLKERRLFIIVLGYLVFPGLHASMDEACVSEWRHKKARIQKPASAAIK